MGTMMKTRRKLSKRIKKMINILKNCF